MIEKIWDQIEDSLIGFFASVALLLICYEVVVRYFMPRFLTDWASEFVVYSTVWALLLAGSILVKYARHIRADIVVRALPPRFQTIIEFVNLVIGFAYCALVARYGFDVTEFALNLDERSESSMQFPLWIFYVALPIAFSLMSIRYLIRIWQFVRDPASERKLLENNTMH